MRAAVPLLAILLACGCERAPSAPRATVTGAVVRLPAVPGRPGAAYFTLRAEGAPVRLVGIESPRIGRVELHETVSAGGVSRMAALRDPVARPGAPLAFAPGGRHAMLHGLDPALAPGDRIPLTFRLDPAPAATVEAEVAGPGDPVDAGR